MDKNKWNAIGEMSAKVSKNKFIHNICIFLYAFWGLIDLWIIR